MQNALVYFGWQECSSYKRRNGTRQEGREPRRTSILELARLSEFARASMITLPCLFSM
jgi:hypothetical protein